MKNKKILTFVILVVLVLLIVFVTLVLRNNELKNRDSVNSKTSRIDLSKFDIENRAKLVLNDEILIGENKKELENGYYDFKVMKDNNIVIVIFNKLWYKEYGTDYIQDDYLAKICREIAKCLNISYSSEELEYQLYKYVKDNYILIKEGMDGPVIDLDEISISSKSEANECVVYIKVD